MLVAFFHHRFVKDLLLEVSAGQLDGGDAAVGAQRVGVAAPRKFFLPRSGETVAKFFPGLGAGALGQRAVQELLCLRPLPLLSRQLRQGHQQRRTVGVGLQPALRTGAARWRRIPTAWASMLLLGPLLFYALWPWLWHDTIGRLRECMGAGGLQ